MQRSPMQLRRQPPLDQVAIFSTLLEQVICTGMTSVRRGIPMVMAGGADLRAGSNP
jgi:hypothetical protein